MRNIASIAAATAGLLAGLAGPAAAMPMQSSAPQHYVWNTAIRNDHRAGEVDGVLNITVSPDGIVQGTYRDADTGRSEIVAGGDENGQIWFDIGAAQRLHVVGTLQNGVLRTVVQAPGPDTITFDSVSPFRS